MCVATARTRIIILNVHHLAMTGLSLDMAMRLKDVSNPNIVFASVPVSAVPDNWCLEEGCTTVERKDESKKATLGAAG